MYGRTGIFVALLLVALVVSRTCGSADQNVSKEEAIDIARANASFEPCPQRQCVQVRFVQGGIPPTEYWVVVLYDEVDADGQPNRIERFRIDVTSGAVSRA